MEEINIYLINIFISIFISISTTFLTNYFWHKYIYNKKRFIWKIKKEFETSVLAQPDIFNKIGTNKGILNSIYARYTFIIRDLLVNNGFDNKKLSIKIEFFFQSEIKPFLSKYHSFNDELEKGCTKFNEFNNDYSELRKKSIIFLMENIYSRKEVKNAQSIYKLSS